MLDRLKALLGRFFGRATVLPPLGAPVAPTETTPSDQAAISLEGFDDPSPAIRFGYRVIFLGLGAFGVWATFAPIDEGVPAQGTVVVETQRKVISHLTGGTVASVHAKENLPVQEGSVLFTLETARLKTALDIALNEYVHSAAKLARLTAEQTFASKIEFGNDLKQQIFELGRQDILTAQEQLFLARQQSFRSEQSILREGLNASRIQTIGAREQLANRAKQTELLLKEIESNRALVEEGYTPRNRLLEQERQLVDLATSSSDIRTRLAREASAIAEIQFRLSQRRQEYLKEVETQASETRRELNTFGERVKDARLDLERATVRAPTSGQIVSMIPLTPGTIVTAGIKLMEIVPEGDKLLLDVQVPVYVIARVHAGLDADIRISSFVDAPSLVIEGRVLSVSSDRREQPNSAQPYYLARVEVTPKGITQLANHRLRPGMTADVVIKTGERSFMAYLMAPLKRQLFQAFKEP
jgi:protease secretion system membrane fusion protein